MRISDLYKLLEPLKQRVLLMIGRVMILAVKSDGVLPELTGELLQGEISANLQLMQQFGYASQPQPGSEGVAVFPMGDRSVGYVVATEDRRVRPKLESGEAAIYSAQDRAEPGETLPEGMTEEDPLHSLRLLQNRIIQASADSAQAGIRGPVTLTSDSLSVDADPITMLINEVPLSFSGSGGLITITAPVPIVLNNGYFAPAGGGSGARPASTTISADTVEIDADTLSIKLGEKTFTYDKDGMPARIGTDKAGTETIVEGP